jgi:low temperature requirement A protein (LtrA)
VFVFAITQLSHHLLGDLTWGGVGQSLLVVWWSCNSTMRATSELDTESIPVRLLMISLMLLSLLMSIAIPQAFEDRALLFAGSYVAIQVGRHAFLTFFASGPRTVERDRAGRILRWFVAAGVLWVGGALVEGPARVALWLAALAVDYGAPLVVYWVPGLRRLEGAVWNVGTEHFAERFQILSSSRSASPSSSPGRPSLSMTSTRGGSVRSGWPSSPRPRCGGCTSTTSPGSRSGGLSSRQFAPRSRGTATRTCTSPWSRVSSSPPSATSW